MSSQLRLAGAPPAPAADVPPWLAKGFRPFFLLAGLHAALIIPLWLLAVRNVVRVDGYLDPMTWHAHEMVYGYTVAVIAGFLLTAVGNWTGRETAVGVPLLALAGLWLLGRVAFVAAGALPGELVAVADLAFLPALAVAIGRPLVATRNLRNYPVLGVVVALWLVGLAIHLDVLGVLAPGWRFRATAGAVDLATLLVLFFSARIFPMFTRNATKVDAIRNWPALDWATVAAMSALTVIDVARPGHAVAPWLAGAVAALALARSVPWGARHTLRHPLLWILHVGHAWIVIGLALRALAGVTDVVTSSAWVHALTAGGLGCTTLGMMARVALGHSGRALAIGRPVTLAFLAVTLAAFVRVVAPIVVAVVAPSGPTAYRAFLDASGTLWTIAFALFVLAYARILTTRRADGRPG